MAILVMASRSTHQSCSRRSSSRPTTEFWHHATAFRTDELRRTRRHCRIWLALIKAGATLRRPRCACLRFAAGRSAWRVAIGPMTVASNCCRPSGIRAGPLGPDADTTVGDASDPSVVPSDVDDSPLPGVQDLLDRVPLENRRAKVTLHVTAFIPKASSRASLTTGKAICTTKARRYVTREEEQRPLDVSSLIERSSSGGGGEARITRRWSRPCNASRSSRVLR
jgi:hypothetical protein